jgi:hypothetical protein
MIARHHQRGNWRCEDAASLVPAGELHGDPLYSGFAGSIKIGWIRRVSGSDRTYWSWMFVLAAYPPEFKTSGTTFELEHAMAAFKRGWIVWLRAMRSRHA